jgi:hypothetical protein
LNPALSKGFGDRVTQAAQRSSARQLVADDPQIDVLRPQAKRARNLIDGGENPCTGARTLWVDRATMGGQLRKFVEE